MEGNTRNSIEYSRQFRNEAIDLEEMVKVLHYRRNFSNSKDLVNGIEKWNRRSILFEMHFCEW